MKATYIQAVTALLADEQSVDTVLVNLKIVLKKHGHERLYAEILSGVIQTLEQQSQRNAVRVAVAKQDDAQKEAVQDIITALEAQNATVIMDIDETLVGGVKATYQSRHLDQTFKTALRHLYGRVTT